MHPRDTFITVYGRKPVLEALADESLEIDKLLVAKSAHGGVVQQILRRAKARGVAVRRCAPKEVTRISKNGRQDQGVVIDVRAPRMETAEGFFERTRGQPLAVLAVDGVTTPANVGLIIRSAAAAGMDAVILPRKGASSINPLLVKASAGTIFKVGLVRAETIDASLEAARAGGVAIIGLAGEGTTTLYDLPIPERAVYVVGSESLGLSEATRAMLTEAVKIPMAAGVESLNVACAATVVCFEVQRRRQAG